MHSWKVFADRLRCEVGCEAQVEALLGDSLLRLQELVPDDFSLRHPPSIQVSAVKQIKQIAFQRKYSHQHASRACLDLL